MLVLITTAFAVVGGIWALRNLPLDAIPDLSDTQVIIYTEFPGQAPQVVEDQVTYLQCLDHADQGPHRHALHRHPYAGRG
jgi:Cu/Ag efflux pump CusA